MKNTNSSKRLFTEKLRSLVKEGDEVDRSYAIRGLAQLKDSDSAELLFHCLHDEDLDVSIDAVSALGELEGEEITDKLIESLLQDPEAEVKVACLESLAKLGDKKAIPHFLKIAEHRPEEMNFDTGDWDLWWDMQLQSIRGLGALKVNEAIPVFKRLIESDEYLDIENEIFNAIVEIGSDESDNYLLELLTDGSARIKRRVAKALGKSQSKATLKLLARSLQYKDSDLREATLLALAERKATQYLPAILLLFRDSNADVRNTSVKVAHQLSQYINANDDHAEELIEKLRLMIRDEDQTVKSTVLTTLMNLGWKANREEAENLAEQLECCSGDCFTALCKVIGTQNLVDGFAKLLFLLRHNSLGNEESIHALLAIGQSGQWNSAIETTLGALVFADAAVVRLAALDALARLNNSFEGKGYKGRLPIEMITEAMQGELKPPASKKIIPIVPIEDIEKKFEQEATQENLEIETQHEDISEPEKLDTTFVDDALDQISKSIEKGEKPHPMSTLDSIAITHVEDELERVAAENKHEEAKQEDDLTDFVALTEQNKQISKWLFNKETIDVGVDIKRLAARILGQIGTNESLTVLLSAFETEDAELKREAALSIAQIMNSDVKETLDDEALQSSLRKALIETLNDDERDLRIASARAIAQLGGIDEIPLLIEKLFDDDVAMRMQTLSSLSEVACRSDDKAINYEALAGLMLDQLKSNKVGIHRAAVEALIPLFRSKLNGSAETLKQTAITCLIQAGLSGSHGQVQEMSWGLKALDKELSSIRLLEKIDEVSSSVERRYMVEMLGEVLGKTA